MIRRIFVTAILTVILIICAIIEKGSLTEKLFTVIAASALSFYWFVETMIDFVMLKKAYKKKFRIYKAEIVNTNNIDLNDIDDKDCYKKFKSSMFRQSAMMIVKPLICFGIFLAILLSVII